MSEESTSAQDDTVHEGSITAAPPPRAAVSAATKFLGRNGGAGTAVIEPIGSAGVRVLMVAEQGGVMGDQVVDDVATAHALIDAVPGLEVGEWDRELTSTATPAPGHWRKMAGWVADT